MSGWLPFGFQQMTQGLPIQVLTRSGPQGPRSITVLLDNADGGGALGAQTTFTFWIVDAD